jgi:hypothetical protein
MGIGSLVWSGTATIPAGTPGSEGSVTVTVAAAGTTSVIVATPSYSSAQDLKVRSKDDINFQIIKSSGSFVIKSNQKENPQVIVDYIVMEISS